MTGEDVMSSRGRGVHTARGALGFVGLVGLLAASLSACGQHVELLSMHDQRLAPESRRWLVDAEDGVAVARSTLDQMSERLYDEERRGKVIRRQAARIGDAGGSAAAAALGDVARLRERLAELAVDRARASLSLALAKQREINAKTAMKHDLAVYDLKPLAQDTARARAAVRLVDRSVHEGRLALEQAQGKWWKVYGSWISTGGRRDLFWLAQERPRPRPRATGTKHKRVKDLKDLKGKGAAGASRGKAGAKGKASSKGKKPGK